MNRVFTCSDGSAQIIPKQKGFGGTFSAPKPENVINTKPTY